MKYEEALNYITSKNKFGEKHGLSGITRLCNKLGNPQRELKFVHVAGTNGKGSTCAYIASVLSRAGYKTGLFTSPFIYEFNERIKINNENISDDALAEIMTEVKAAIDELSDEGFSQPTEFEVITAAAFLYFNRKKCDIVVLEVGLGGRFDSTNVIEKPLVSVICSVGYDHMQYLGNTLEEIAFEKCGIIKKGSTVISYPCQNDEVKAVIVREASKRNAKLICCDKENIKIREINLSGAIFDACGLVNVKTGLCGEHQVFNAVTAISALKELSNCGYAIDDEVIKKGIAETKWTARMERLYESPCLIFDGAHNIDGINSFVKNIGILAKGKSIIIISGMVSDKEYDKCIAELASVADVLITTSIANPRGATAEKLMSAAAGAKCDKVITSNVSEAIDKAFSLCNENGMIFAVGSLYMAEEVKTKLEQKREYDRKNEKKRVCQYVN